VNYAVHVYGFAGTFKLKEIARAFPPDAQVAVEKDELRATFGGDAFARAYDFGALVFVGCDAASEAPVVEAVRNLSNDKAAPLTESFAIQLRPGASLEVRFDRVIVPELSPALIDIVALVLAQSVAMDYYAQDVAEIEAATDRIADELRSRGRIRRGVRDLTKFIGLCIATRSDVVSTLALFDKPDATWESEELDRLWNGMYKMLEMDGRYRALEAKLRLFQENLVLLVDLARGRHTLALEALVAVLILLEMLVMVWQVLSAHS
jgi:required for meiotic nuclear division protein 1